VEISDCHFAGRQSAANIRARLTNTGGPHHGMVAAAGLLPEESKLDVVLMLC